MMVWGISAHVGVLAGILCYVSRLKRLKLFRRVGTSGCKKLLTMICSTLSGSHFRSDISFYKP